MKRASIIIHSIGGNCYILGSYLTDLLQNKGVDARLYRVKDDDLHLWAERLDTTNEYYEDIIALPTASNELLVKSDMVVLGCPTRFGNMTAEMKAFLDDTLEMSEAQTLKGRLFGCFTSCLHSTNEGVHTLDNLVFWAQAQCMVHIPFGVRLGSQPYENQPAAGLVHLGGLGGVVRPSTQLGELMGLYADDLAACLGD